MTATEKTADPFELVRVVTPEAGEIVELSRGFAEGAGLELATDADEKKAEKAAAKPAKP